MGDFEMNYASRAAKPASAKASAAPVTELMGPLTSASRRGPPVASACAIPVGEVAPAGAPDPMVAAFVRAVLAPSDGDVRMLVDDVLARGVSVQSIYLDLLAPAARALGDMWQDDACDFVEVTTGVGRLQLILRDLSQMFVRDRPDEEIAGRVLLACMPGEQHSLGLFMVAEFFVRDGWEVHVGPPLSGEELLADVRSEWYDIVGFSVSCDSRLDHLKREIRRVRQASRNRDVLILTGGRAFNDHPDLLRRVGADASAANAELAPEVARQMLAR